MIFFDFDPCSPRSWIPLFGGWRVGVGVGGGQNFFMHCGRCVCIWTWFLRTFFLSLDTIIHGRGPGSQLQGPPDALPPPIWPTGKPTRYSETMYGSSTRC